MHKSTFLDSLKDTEKVLSDINLDSIIISPKLCNAENVSNLRRIREDIEIYADFPVFCGEDLIKLFPDAIPVEAFGKDLIKEGLTFVCPTHLEIRELLLNKIKELIKLDINGIWLDCARYPTVWDKPNPIIYDTCYCERCLSLFEEFIGEKIVGDTLEDKFLHIDGSYYIEWLRFKCDQITSFVGLVRKVIFDSEKSIKLGIFVVPWEDNEYSAGIKRILGIDLEQMAPLVDTVSPMLYHKMCGKDVEWVKEKVNYYWNLGKSFLPLIQTENIPKEIELEEFKKSMGFAVLKPSAGVCLFYLDNLIKQPNKYETAKNFFNSEM